MVNAGRHIPNRLRKHRKIAGLRQQDVAKLLGHKSTCRISRWEKGLSMPSAFNLLKLSILYGVLPQELYFETYVQFKRSLQKESEIFAEV